MALRIARCAPQKLLCMTRKAREKADEAEESGGVPDCVRGGGAMRRIEVDSGEVDQSGATAGEPAGIRIPGAGG